MTEAFTLVTPDGWIQTYSGRRFYPFAPRESDLDLHDIAHVLSQINRFNGHTTRPYSVAAHSLHVAGITPSPYKLTALLHDASEVYLCDIPRPLKRLPEFRAYREAEERLQNMIYDHWKADRSPEALAAVAQADDIALAAEAMVLMPRRELKEWRALPPEHTNEVGPVDTCPLSPSVVRDTYLRAVYSWIR